MKKVVITGAAGFTGCNLVEELLRQNYFVYAVVRPNSAHNKRLAESENLKLIPLDFSEYNLLAEKIFDTCDYFFHLTWQGEGGRDNFFKQYENMQYTVKTLEAAKKIGCKRFICTGSQAEYGSHDEIITEETLTRPFDAYGTAKLATCHLTRNLAKQLEIDWIWGRIFSTYGKYEPAGRMLPDLVKNLMAGKSFSLSSATQYWDYLYSKDAAKALIALAEKGNAGEIYNIANGNYRPLKEFTEEIRRIVAPNIILNYGKTPTKIVSLRPSVEKIFNDTGWKAETSFSDGIKEVINFLK